MDIQSELWSTKKQSQLLQLLGTRQLNTDELETDDDSRSDFACPYCDEDFDIVSLCSHLEEDHCNGKLSMCPVCGDQVESDVIGHISAQHATLFKGSRKNRLRKSKDISTSLDALLEANRATSSSSTDHDFLQTLVSVTREVEEALTPATSSSSKEDMMVDDEKFSISFESETLSSEQKEKAARRAQFFQHLVLSTIWPDS